MLFDLKINCVGTSVWNKEMVGALDQRNETIRQTTNGRRSNYDTFVRPFPGLSPQLNERDRLAKMAEGRGRYGARPERGAAWRRHTRVINLESMKFPRLPLGSLNNESFSKIGLRSWLFRKWLGVPVIINLGNPNTPRNKKS